MRCSLPLIVALASPATACGTDLICICVLLSPPQPSMQTSDTMAALATHAIYMETASSHHIALPSTSSSVVAPWHDIGRRELPLPGEEAYKPGRAARKRWTTLYLSSTPSSLFSIADTYICAARYIRHFNRHRLLFLRVWHLLWIGHADPPLYLVRSLYGLTLFLNQH